MKHRAVIFAAAFACLAMSATAKAPDASALDAAREEVRAILAGDFIALNGGRMSLIDLADRAAALAAAGDSPARSRVLQEGAFNLYRAAGAIDRAAERRVPFWINLGSDAEFEFAACPAGSFMMGCNGDPKSESFRHKVNISRPFWIARLQTTKRLYGTFRRVGKLSAEERLYGGVDIPAGGLSRKDIDAFCDFLTDSNKSRIPEGYVFRLPTDAEWEYALNAGCDDSSDPYVQFRNGGDAAAGEIAVAIGAVNAHRKANGLAPVRDGQGTVFKGGTRRPNAWGVYDMLGNGGEILFDTFTADVKRRYGEGVFTPETSFDFGYADEMTDPVRQSADPKRLGMMRGAVRYRRFAPRWYGRTVIDRSSHMNGHYTFRIVLAPEIPREQPGEESKK